MRKIEQENIQEFFKIWGKDTGCCLCGEKPIQIHHNLIHGGRQSNNPRTLLPVCVSCHNKANEKDTREQLDLVMLSQFTEDDFDEFSKAIDYKGRYAYLRLKYEET